MFVTYDGQVKLVDFGIAKAMGSTQETRAGMLKGKIAYMPAEQARGRAVDRRSDIYAVGVMLWEAIACRRMWPRTMNDVEVLASVVVGELPSLTEHAPDAPAAHAHRGKGLGFRFRTGVIHAPTKCRLTWRRTSTGRDRCPPPVTVRPLAGSFSEERTKMRALIDARIRSSDDHNGTVDVAGALRATRLAPLSTDDDLRKQQQQQAFAGRWSPTGGSLSGGALRPRLPRTPPRPPCESLGFRGDSSAIVDRRVGRDTGDASEQTGRR